MKEVMLRKLFASQKDYWGRLSQGESADPLVGVVGPDLWKKTLTSWWLWWAQTFGTSTEWLVVVVGLGLWEKALISW